MPFRQVNSYSDLKKYSIALVMVNFSYLTNLTLYFDCFCITHRIFKATQANSIRKTFDTIKKINNLITNWENSRHKHQITNPFIILKFRLSANKLPVNYLKISHRSYAPITLQNYFNPFF